MRVLILSCNTGGGHNAAGEAISERIRMMGHEAVMQDVMLLAGRRTSRAVGGAYVGIVKHTPWLFGLLYRAGMCISSAKRKSPVYAANIPVGRCLEKYLRENAFDVIVTPHLFAAEALTYLKRRGVLHQKVLAVTTDYTCIPFWEETECDGYVLPHRGLVGEYVQRGLPKEKLFSYGMPVRAAFSHKKDRAQARRECGLDLQRPAYLIMSGSMGFGKMERFVSVLANALHGEGQIVMICGNNEPMRRTLQNAFAANPDMQILGYTDRVEDYMDACDVVFTKPGGLSSSEAAVKNLPIVYTEAIPGCETRNLAFFTERGMAATAPDIRGQIELGLELARPGDVREHMLAAQRKEAAPDAAEKIFQLLLDWGRKNA